MANLKYYITKLLSLEDLLRNRFGVKHLIVFGSVSRNEQKEDSDLDICVDTQTPNPFLLIDLKDFLSAHLGIKVDVVRNHRGINPYLYSQIQNEGIQVI